MPTSIKEFLTSLQGKKVLIYTISGLHFETASMQVLDDSVIFTDRLNHRVLLKFEQIARVHEIPK